MNQNRVSWIFAIAIAVCFIGAGTLFALWQTTTTLGYGAILFSLVFLALGARELYALMEQMNDWMFNLMPTHYEDLPVGFWEVVGATQNQHVAGDMAAYIIIARTEGFRRHICAVRIPFAWMDIRDTQLIRDGKQPLSISIGACIKFVWVEFEEAPITPPSQESRHTTIP